MYSATHYTGNPKILLPSDWRILLTGMTSIHGWPIYQTLQQHLPRPHLHAVCPPKTTLSSTEGVSALTITDETSLEHIRDNFKPTHIVHCAGVCDLNVCEARPAWAHDLNVNGAKIVRRVFGDRPILYVSTDLVFSGNDPPEGGYREDHPPCPVSVAGETFRLAEEEIGKCRRHCILRVSLPLGDSMVGHKGAVDWMETRFKKGLPVTLFHDEYRSCVHCAAIGDMVPLLLLKDATGLFHFGGDKRWSLYEIGQYVLSKGDYRQDLLKGMLRHDEIDGPPRIGDVSLNSNRLKRFLQSDGCAPHTKW
ncbi:MAG: sugar nucleotide-binding protein [Planctomycetes bacterium]|nr:sugar nucleotide-binding protein [Planctomycetota bacterium]